MSAYNKGFPPQVQDSVSIVLTGPEMLGTQLAALTLPEPVSATWPSANRRYYFPYQLTRPQTLRAYWALNGAAAADNFAFALYDENFVLIPGTTVASTAQAGTNTIQRYAVTATTVPQGRGYLSIACDGTTGTLHRQVIAGNEVIRSLGMFIQAAAFAAPATATPAAGTGGYIPVCGMTFSGTVPL